MSARYDIGQPVVLPCAFTVGTTPTDPSALTLVVTDPTGATTTYTYPSPLTITRLSTGSFTKTVTASIAGTWSYVWTGTGAAADVASGSFTVFDTSSGRSWLTVDEARDYVKIGVADVSTKLVILSRLVPAVSARLDKCIGPMVHRTVTSEQHNGGACHVRLRYFPIYSFTSVTEYWLASPLVLTRETLGTAPSSAYFAEQYRQDAALFSGKLTRREGGTDYSFYPGRGNVAVTYVAGRAASTGAVDLRYKEAAGMVLRYLWQQNDLSVAKVADFDVPQITWPKFAIPNAVRDMLSDEWQLGPLVG